MSRRFLVVGLMIAAGVLAPRAAVAQDHQHGDHGAADHPADHDHAAAGHDHAGPIVSCTDLAAPPWNGLPTADRERVAALRASVEHLATPDAAQSAGFRPALGDIPGMGVHFVHSERGRNGVRPGEPDHLLFSEIGGELTLVGAAYAFIDVPDTTEPIPFDSDLARWHDHPEFAPDGQTLHMLHVWFVPSSHGPFAGLNFWLPFENRGITPPSSCWLSDPEIANLIQGVSFGLVRRGSPVERAVLGDRAAAAPEATEESTPNREAILADLDAAARANNLNAWLGAAERFVADLTPAERMRTQMMLRALTNAQLSSAEREQVGN